MKFAMAAMVLALAGCATLGGGNCRDQMVDKIYFGMATPSGEVTEAEFERFVEREITPRFPAGFTIYSASGQWRGADQAIVRERSRVVEVVHEGTMADEAKLATIAAGYKSQFRQEAVLRTRMPGRACL